MINDAKISIKSTSQYKSIKNIDWSVTSRLSVITGENGVGKSHLLELIAISFGFPIDQKNYSDQERPAKISGISIGNSDLLYVKANKSLVFNDAVEMTELEEKVEKLYQRPFSSRDKTWKNSGNLYEGFIVKRENSYETYEVIGPSLSEFRNRLTPSIITNEKLAGQTPDLALLFFSYSILKADALYRGISEEEIRRNYGEPPWEILNRIFTIAGLNFSAQEPELPIPSIFSKNHKLRLKLKDTSRNILVSPNDLSSGEKALAAMVFLYYTFTHGKSKYRMLLLDEPDANLHPYFVSKFLKILIDVFVNELNVTVFMTTHSPTTIALVPDTSIFIHDKNSENGPRKASKDEALKSLLIGVPSISVQHENRRQVFVESKYDVSFYDAIFASLCQNTSLLNKEISINFISSGNGEAGSCDQVKQVVNSLKNNPFIFGIIDWDRRNISQDRIFVIEESVKYSLENVIFDPLALGTFLVHEGNSRPEIYGFKKYSAEILNMTDEELQTVCDIICTCLERKVKNIIARAEKPIDGIESSGIDFKKYRSIIDAYEDAVSSIDSEKEDFDTIKYISGQSVKSKKWVSKIRGHDLEDLIMETYPELKKYRKPGELKSEIRKKFYDCYTKFIPESLVDIFKKIQNG